MGILSNISTEKAIAALKRDGWLRTRQRGSHIILTKPGMKANISIPERREVSAGVLRSAIKSAELTLDEFLALL